MAPPSDISMYVSSSKYATYPFLEQVVHVPVFTPEGKLHTKPGYDEDLRVFLRPDLEFYELPSPITDGDVDTALDLLLGNALRDFPFSDAFDGNELAPIKLTEVDEDGFPLPNYDRGPSSRANALALILQQFCRSMIKGPTPAYHLDKASPGTGANYLADVVSMILEGTRCTPTPMAKENDEVRKTITSLLRESPNIAFFDNINRKVTSEAIAAALTTGIWKDRILGVSETTGKVPIKCAWIFAGNNLDFSHELYRRNVPIRMDAACPNPAVNRGPKDFKHFPLHTWLEANRRELVWACHVLIGWWVQKGMPRSSMVFNSFDEYAAVMGGILESVGVRDFGVNIPDYLGSKDEDANEADVFIGQIHEKLKKEKLETFTSRDLYAMMKNPVTQAWEGAIEPSGTHEQAQLTSLGMTLSRELLGKTFDITDAQENIKRLKLIKINKSSPTKYQLITLTK